VRGDGVMSDDPETSQAEAPETPSVDRRLLEFLVCPLTKTTLIYNHQRQELISRAAGLAYPIRSGVPLMIEETARRLCDDDYKD
jgi:uncharacterized protein